MESKEPTVFTSTYKEGVERVLEGNFAFLCESSMLEYVGQNNCILTQIGGWWTAKGMELQHQKVQNGRIRYLGQSCFFKRKAPFR